MKIDTGLQYVLNRLDEQSLNVSHPNYDLAVATAYQIRKLILKIEIMEKDKEVLRKVFGQGE